MSNTSARWNELCHVLQQGDPDAAATLLEKHPGLLDERNGIGETVLHFLAVEDNLPPIVWLHERGADLNATNEFGTPLLFEVALLGYRDLYLWLVQHGADASVRSTRDDQSLEEYLTEHSKLEMLAFIKQHASTGE